MSEMQRRKHRAHLETQEKLEAYEKKIQRQREQISSNR